jgi:hypothetical protein
VGPRGYYALGDFVEQSLASRPSLDAAALVAQEEVDGDEGSAGEDLGGSPSLLADPVDYELLWTTAGTAAKAPGNIYRLLSYVLSVLTFKLTNLFFFFFLTFANRIVLAADTAGRLRGPRGRHNERHRRPPVARSSQVCPHGIIISCRTPIFRSGTAPVTVWLLFFFGGLIVAPQEGFVWSDKTARARASDCSVWAIGALGSDVSVAGTFVVSTSYEPPPRSRLYGLK